MAISINTTLNSRTDMIGALRALQDYFAQPVSSSIDDQGIGQAIIVLQKYLATVPDATQPSGFKFDPALVRSNIADHTFPAAIINLQSIGVSLFNFLIDTDGAILTDTDGAILLDRTS